MQRAYQIFKLLLLICGCLALMGISLFFFQLREGVISAKKASAEYSRRLDENRATLMTELAAPCKKVGKKYACGIIPQLGLTIGTVDSLAASLQTPVNKLDTTLDKVNAPCPPNDADKLHPCGTVADVGKFLNTGRRTMGQVEIAVNHEDKNLGKLDTQEDDLFTSFHTSLDSLNTDLTGFQEASTRLNALLANKSIPIIIDNTAKGSTTVDHMLFTFDKVETKAAHGYLYPSHNPFVVMKPFLLPGLQIVGAIATSVK